MGSAARAPASPESSALRGARREEANRVHLLQEHRHLRGRGLDHARQEERRVIVGHHHRGAGGERGEEAFAGAGLGLDVRVVESPRPREASCVVGHPLEDEAVEAIAGEGIADPERLEDEERLAERAGALDRPVEREAVASPARGDHPVEDEVAPRIDRAGVGGAYSDRGDGAHEGTL